MRNRTEKKRNRRRKRENKGRKEKRRENSRENTRVTCRRGSQWPYSRCRQNSRLDWLYEVAGREQGPGSRTRSKRALWRPRCPRVPRPRPNVASRIANSATTNDDRRLSSPPLIRSTLLPDGTPPPSLRCPVTCSAIRNSNQPSLLDRDGQAGMGGLTLTFRNGWLDAKTVGEKKRNEFTFIDFLIFSLDLDCNWERIFRWLSIVQFLWQFWDILEYNLRQVNLNTFFWCIFRTKIVVDIKLIVTKFSLLFNLP